METVLPIAQRRKMWARILRAARYFRRRDRGGKIDMCIFVEGARIGLYGGNERPEWEYDDSRGRSILDYSKHARAERAAVRFALCLRRGMGIIESLPMSAAEVRNAAVMLRTLREQQVLNAMNQEGMTLDPKHAILDAGYEKFLAGLPSDEARRSTRALVGR